MDRNEQFQFERQHAINSVALDVSIDHGAHFSPDMIEAMVTESYDRLAEKATNTQFLGTLAGNLTRKRLRALGKLDGSVAMLSFSSSNSASPWLTISIGKYYERVPVSRVASGLGFPRF